MTNKLWRKVRKKLTLWDIFSGILVIGLIITFRWLGMLQLFELAAFDLLLSLRPAEPIDERILIIGIEQSDFQQSEFSNTSPISGRVISDQVIADLLDKLKSQPKAIQPAVIGLNIRRPQPFEPGSEKLKKVFEEMNNLVVIEQVLFPQIQPPANFPRERVGFSDYLLDSDAKTRRFLLGTPRPHGLDGRNSNNEEDDNYALSFAIRLAKLYLKDLGYELGNGEINRQSMRFYSKNNSSELPFLTSNFGGYVRADAGGTQSLLNFRSGKNPFQIISLSDLNNDKFDFRLLRDRIVIIGLTDSLTAVPVYTNSVSSSRKIEVPPDKPQEGQEVIHETTFLSRKGISGTELQAHAVSQIVSATLDKRVLLQAWEEKYEYFWIIGWSLLGFFLIHDSRRKIKTIAISSLASVIFFSIAYLFVLFGLWIPVLPPLFCLWLNTLIVFLVLVDRDRILLSRLNERQQTIEDTFNIIHSNPLQSLALILRRIREDSLSKEELILNLEELNREIRSVGEYLRNEPLFERERFYFKEGMSFDLKSPMHELFYEIYSATIEQNLPGFKTIKFKVREFDSIEERYLNISQKRELCMFFQEALCNVGKHAIASTCLTATGRQHNGWYILRVEDNGLEAGSNIEGRGTKQSKKLAKRMGGRFRRDYLSPQGTLCELTWRLR